VLDLRTVAPGRGPRGRRGVPRCPRGPVVTARSRAGPGPVGRSVHVVATAGHVDHGKSSLVLALTGTDPDRWPEEKARGLTIDLGFAGARLPSGRRCALVDVPGHVRFIKNMLAGVGAVDAAPLRGGRDGGLEAPVRGAPADPRAAGDRSRRRGPHQGRPGRRRRPGARPAWRSPSASPGHPWPGRRSWRSTRRPGRGWGRWRPPWTGSSPSRPPPRIGAGPGSGSTGPSRRRARARWSPARSGAGRCTSTTRSWCCRRGSGGGSVASSRSTSATARSAPATGPR
jgi:hypothetical protein